MQAGSRCCSFSTNQRQSGAENPFEGGANDVPISTLCNYIERDLKEMLGEHAGDPSSQAIIAL
jgi:putative membrane protein